MADAHLHLREAGVEVDLEHTIAGGNHLRRGHLRQGGGIGDGVRRRRGVDVIPWCGVLPGGGQGGCAKGGRCRDGRSDSAACQAQVEGFGGHRLSPVCSREDGCQVAVRCGARVPPALCPRIEHPGHRMSGHDGSPARVTPVGTPAAGSHGAGIGCGRDQVARDTMGDRVHGTDDVVSGRDDA